ncbi:hypothetical protein HaLaN_14363, partial [Haematococcus lacustris]
MVFKALLGLPGSRRTKMPQSTQDKWLSHITATVAHIARSSVRRGLAATTHPEAS